MPEFPPMDYSLLGQDVVEPRSELPLAMNAIKPPAAVKLEELVPSPIYGTERDKVNCSFYLKVGACRHGDLCSRLHHRPKEAKTVILKNFYINPVVDIRQADAFDRVGEPNKAEQTYFDEFYEEVFNECKHKYGRVQDIVVCENIGEHMVGNVYVQFYKLEDAMRAVEDLNNRWFNGAPVYAEPSPVTDFKSAMCRQHAASYCSKGGFCNFLHIKNPSRDLEERLFGNRRDEERHYDRSGRIEKRRDGERYYERSARIDRRRDEESHNRPRYARPIKREKSWEMSPVRESRRN